MDNEELLGLLGSMGSAIVLLGGWLTQQIIAIPVGAVVLSTFLAYFFGRRMQTSIRKYERQSLSVTEVLGIEEDTPDVRHALVDRGFP